MMSVRPWAISVLLLVGAPLLTGQAVDSTEEACTRELESDIIPQFLADRYEGESARERLLDLLEPLRQRHQTTAPVCVGRGVEMENVLHILNGRPAEAVRVSDAFLSGPGRATSIRSRINITKDRGYALIHMGELREGAQSYYAAASLADQTEADRGAWILIASASVARNLGDFHTTQRYLADAREIIRREILAQGEDPDVGLFQIDAQALVNEALLAYDRMVLKAEGPHVDSLARDLERRALRAIQAHDILDRYTGYHATDPRNAGYESLATNLYAIAAAYRGDNALAQERLAASLSLARQARASYPTILLEAYNAVAAVARLAGDHEGVRRATDLAYREAIELGEVGHEASALETMGGLAEARDAWKEAADFYERAIGLRERQRERLGLQDWSAAVFSAMQEGYRGLARVRLAEGRVEDAFWTLDRTRGRYLRDLRRHLAIRDRLTPEDQAVADSVGGALADARKALMDDGITGGERAALITRVSELRERLDRLVGSANSEVEERSYDMEELQRQLGARDQVLVSYLLSASGSVAFVVRPDTLIGVDLGATPGGVRALLDDAGAPWRDGEAADPAFSLGALHELHQALGAPVRPWIPSGASVIIVPDGPLAAVPFAMLTTAPSLDYRTAPYLVQEWAVTTELAASLVLEHAPRVETDLRYDLLAYGRTAFDDELAPWEAVAALGDLPYVDDELRRVERYVGSSRIALDEEATEADLDAHLGTARIVHIASHAEPDASLPLYSRIALWDGPSDDDDGVIHLYELQGRSLPADLVVLSGCSTARGEAQAGEGMIGLQYAVRSAGAQASLATLWPVDDEAMVELMGGFYKGLREGLTKERALQQAQIAYLDQSQGLAASPFFWAAPVLSGNTAPIPLGSPGLGLWGVGVVLALAGGGLAWHLRQRTVHV